MKRHFAGCLSALLAIMIASLSAIAQTTQVSQIGVLDVRLLITKSAAAKDIRFQIKRIMNKYQQDVSRRESILRKDQLGLLEQRSVLSDEAFAKRRRQFEIRARKEQQEVRTRKVAIERAHINAENKIKNAFLKIAMNVAIEKKINIVMAKSAVLLSLKNLEITAETMKRLNKQLPKVAVEAAKKN